MTVLRKFCGQHAFMLSILFLLLLTAAASTYRFYIQQDYLVKNEIECDPYTESCYVWCEDESCAEPYYYAYATRSAMELGAICGPDISDCDAAWYCDSEEVLCDVSYCSPDFSDCDALSDKDMPEKEVINDSL